MSSVTQAYRVDLRDLPVEFRYFLGYSPNEIDDLELHALGSLYRRAADISSRDHRTFRTVRRKCLKTITPVIAAKMVSRYGRKEDKHPFLSTALATKLSRSEEGEIKEAIVEYLKARAKTVRANTSRSAGSSDSGTVRRGPIRLGAQPSLQQT